MAVEQVERGRSVAGAEADRGGGRREPPVLWHLKVSHYNEKARWALDYKRVPHVRRALMPGLHRRKARRLSEAGVRFVEICHPGWDQHNNLHAGLTRNCAAVDHPTAALLADLEARGLLAETLVLFGSEFGRLPTAQGPDGRDHNITGYPMWLAGAGVKKGFTHGATDEYGLKAVEGRMHTNDLHATLLALLGLDHEKLAYRYAGRDFRLTDVAGRVAKEIFA